MTPFLALLTGLALLQDAPVQSVQKISPRHGGLLAPLADRDQFGRSVAALGDLDGDGVGDLAVGAHGDDTGGSDRGAIHVLFLDPDGWVRASTKISALEGGFTGELDDGDQLGRALVGIGDLDGDGVPDLAAGTCYDDDGGPDRGAVWILFLRPDGSVRSQAKISSTSGGMDALSNRDQFGRALAAPGDLDLDGVPDLVVSAPYDAAGGPNKGAVHVLFMNRDGSVKGHSEISLWAGGFTGPLRPGDLFGFSLAAPGDLNGDQVPDLIAGAVGDDDGGLNAGAVWVLFLNRDGTLLGQQKIGPQDGAFSGILGPGDQFGASTARIGDLDRDGRMEVLVGAVKADDGGLDRGVVWILFLEADGTVRRHQKLSSTGEFPLRIDNFDWFASSVSALGDLNGDGLEDLAVGSRMDDDGGLNRGSVFMLFMAPHSPRSTAGTRGQLVPR